MLISIPRTSLFQNPHFYPYRFLYASIYRLVTYESDGALWVPGGLEAGQRGLHNVSTEANFTTYSSEASEISHLIPAPLQFYQQNSETFVDCPELSWSERFFVRGCVVRGSVFHSVYTVMLQPGSLT